MTGLYCFFQINQEVLLLLILLPHFPMLLFKHVSIMLGDVERGGRRHDDIRKSKKTFFCLYIVDLGTIMGFFGKT